MSRRDVVTVERQGGYAARCNVCGAITFGGFPSRSAARAALWRCEEGTHDFVPALESADTPSA